MTFYTALAVLGNNIGFRGYNDNGRRINAKYPFDAKLFIPCRPGEVTDVYGVGIGSDPAPVKLHPASGEINRAKKLIREVERIPGYQLFGYPKWEYAYAVERWPYGTQVPFDKRWIKVGYLDIEVYSDEGFPEPADAQYPVTAITLALEHKTLSFGYKDYTGTRLTNYVRCANEEDMLRKFLYVFKHLDLDVVSGWNIRKFDIPYLMQRLQRLWGGEPTWNQFLGKMIPPKLVGSCLSPWDRAYSYQMTEMGREYVLFRIAGLAIVDYLELYIKYGSQSKQESYKLDYIAQVELKERKLDYGVDVKTLGQLYERDFNRYMDYNAHDAELVMRLDKAKNLMSLVYDMAYLAKVQFEDVFHQTRMWDNMIYAKLQTRNQVVPAIKSQVSNEGVDIAGAFVKPPYVGRHPWLVSLDVTSEYPSAMMQWNISPETLVSRARLQELKNRATRLLEKAS